MFSKLSELFKKSMYVTSATAVVLMALTATSYAQDDTNISKAEESYRSGVKLYAEGNYREAQTKFGKALALDSENESIKEYLKKTNEMLAIEEVGAVKSTDEGYPIFENILPEAEASDYNSAKEFKIIRVRELNELGERYLEHGFNKESMESFTQVLQLAPDNRRAKQGYYKAVLRANEDVSEEYTKDIKVQHKGITTEIDRMKVLPDGADLTGIKPFKLLVPTVEEEIEVVIERMDIEDILDTAVSVVFEDIHIKDLLEVLIEEYEINIMLDDRVIASPKKKVDPNEQVFGPPVAVAPQRTSRSRGRNRGTTSSGSNIDPATGEPKIENDDYLVTDGMIKYVNLKNVSLREALQAVLKPLNLTYEVQKSFVWITTHEKIRTESFEPLETRVYEVKNAGAETLFKMVLAGSNNNSSSGSGSGSGSSGSSNNNNSGGNSSGGSSNNNDTNSGSIFGNIVDLFYGNFPDSEVGEYPNSALSGYGYGGGNSGGNSSGGNAGGRSSGGSRGGSAGGRSSGGSRGGSAGGRSSGGRSSGGSRGGSSGSRGGNSGGRGGSSGGRGGNSGGSSGGYGYETGPGLGISTGQAGEPRFLTILRSLVPGVAEPVTQKELSYMYYNLINNQLIVHNTPKNHEILARNLKELDKTPQQVAIEAKFLTLQVGDFEKKGFDWDFNATDVNTRAIPGSIQGEPIVSGSNNTFPDSFIPPGTTVDLNGDGVAETFGPEENADGSRNGTSFVAGESLGTTITGANIANFSGAMRFFNTLDGDGLEVAFEFLDSLDESELLSAPRVTTMNQKPAMLAEFTTQYFLTDVTQNVTASTSTGNSTQGGQSSTNQSVTAFNDGIAFSVTPQISENQIRMWMNPTVTKIIGVKEFPVVSSDNPSDVVSFPIYTTKSVWTNVIVLDGDTVVLGGLIEDNTNRNEERLPYISDIPVIGYFFRGSSKSVTQSSLLIFVTPTIIDRSGARYFESDVL